MTGDPVNRPAHYTFGKYEVIDVLEDWFPADPLLWQTGKYIARAGRKGAMLEDLQKAAWYFNHGKYYFATRPVFLMLESDWPNSSAPTQYGLILKKQIKKIKS
jgi:hypothetical protein